MGYGICCYVQGECVVDVRRGYCTRETLIVYRMRRRGRSLTLSLDMIG